MGYSALSDFDIAKAVLEASGAQIAHSEEDIVMYLCGSNKERKEVGSGASKQFSFDPCNNPADAWPIIVENRLYVDPIFINDWSVTSECDSFRMIDKTRYVPR